MRYPPSGPLLPMGPPAITTHQLGDVPIASKPVVLSDASPHVAEAQGRTHFVAVVFGCRAGAAKPGRPLFPAVPREVGVARWQTFYCGDGGGDELVGRMP
ncbi:hypothetical protein J2Z21_009345 [Streptomyces griseochromogenes]|uniref:Uncharacterized protein n=1 Tax=Streptomyces griseochromogenes TaxID=68214 RepID=A0A1B1B4D3_9ACTN|nr:hypothetical protein [Streptomyces griseochromogenes]ANP53660.1 hypothetical protein AVL59_32615 [Streptomyces griseochromogenes]MBP2056327.1 hypothetical protein [Streptomyces griseochromogenes]